MNIVNLRCILVLAVASLGIVTWRVSDGFGGCAPGCKICLLDVCADKGAQDAPGVKKPDLGQGSKPASISEDPLVNRENELKGLKPSDFSPVKEWSGVWSGDYLDFANDFIAAGYCYDSKRLTAEGLELKRGFTPAQQAELARAPIKRSTSYDSDAGCMARKQPLGCRIEWRDSRDDKEEEFRAMNARKKQEVEAKLKVAVDGLAKYKNYDCKK